MHYMLLIMPAPNDLGIGRGSSAAIFIRAICSHNMPWINYLSASPIVFALKGDVVCHLYGDRQVPIMHVDQNIRAEHSKGRHGHVTPDCRVQRRRKGPKVTSGLDGLKLRAVVVSFFLLVCCWLAASCDVRCRTPQHTEWVGPLGTKYSRYCIRKALG